MYHEGWYFALFDDEDGNEIPIEKLVVFEDDIEDE